MRISVLTLAILSTFPAWAGAWSEPEHVLLRGDLAVTYRARVAGGHLIVEAKHAPGWHTYSMDNKRRAREATGKKSPECELPTVIEISGGLEKAGEWRQTKPKDLSQPEIHWYTWGFEGTAVFAVPVKTADGTAATITINAQACNASSCQMVHGLVLSVPVDSAAADGLEAAGTIEDLVVVERVRKAPATQQ